MILDEFAYGDVTYLDLLISALVLIISVFVAKTVTIIIQRFLRDKIGKDHLNNILKFSYYIVIIIAVIMVLPILGIESSGFLVAGGIGGIVLGFASQSIVSNLLSGVFLMFERPIKIGDTVNVEGTTGIVEDIKIISTTIRTFNGVYVRIPNDKVFTTSITNYVTNVARRFEYVVGIRYSDDAGEAIKIIKNLIEEEPFALKNPSPLIFVDTLGDNTVNIIVKPWAPSTDWFDLKTKLLWKIKKTLEENGIEIAFPQRTVWFAKDEKYEDIDSKF